MPGHSFVHIVHNPSPTPHITHPSSIQTNQTEPPPNPNRQEEWALDYKYAYSTDPLAAKIFPAGHVHEGLFEMFKMVYADLEKASVWV